MWGEKEDQLGVIVRPTDRRDSCKCGREVAPVYHSILNVPIFNKNGKRPADDSELDLLAESTEQGQSTELVRIVAAPTPAKPAPTQGRKWATSCCTSCCCAPNWAWT